MVMQVTFCSLREGFKMFKARKGGMKAGVMMMTMIMMMMMMINTIFPS